MRSRRLDLAAIGLIGSALLVMLLRGLFDSRERLDRSGPAKRVDATAALAAPVAADADRRVEEIAPAKGSEPKPTPSSGAYADEIRVHLLGPDSNAITRVTAVDEGDDSGGAPLVAAGVWPQFVLRPCNARKYAVCAEFPWGSLVRRNVPAGSDVDLQVDRSTFAQRIHVQRRDGTAVAGASVELRRGNKTGDELIPATPVEAKGVTDSLGDAVLPAAPRHCSFRVFANAGPRRGRAVVHCAPDPPQPVVVTLKERPRRIVGRVVDSDHHAIAGANLRVDRIESVESGADGRFELSFWPEYDDVLVDVRCDGFLRHLEERKLAAADGSAEVVRDLGDVVLDRGVLLDVRVVGEDRSPIPNAMIGIEGEVDRLSDGASGDRIEINFWHDDWQRADASGRAHVNWYPSREAWLEVSARGHTLQRVLVPPRDPQSTLPPLTVVLPSGFDVDLIVDGSALGSDAGAALNSLEITLRLGGPRFPMQSDAASRKYDWFPFSRIGTNRFRREGVASGKYFVHLCGPEVVSQDLVIDVAREPFTQTVAVAHGAVVSGRVVDEHGDPLADVIVALLAAEDHAVLGQKLSSRDGTFRFACAADSSAGLAVRAHKFDGDSINYGTTTVRVAANVENRIVVARE